MATRCTRRKAAPGTTGYGSGYGIHERTCPETGGLASGEAFDPQSNFRQSELDIVADVFFEVRDLDWTGKRTV